MSLESHIKETLRLTNSLVIKFSATARMINQGLIIEGYNISSKPSTWKYYLNLAGEKHETNSDVLINVIELGEKLSLSKSLLDKYPYTRQELIKQEDFYKSLITKYPKDELFIKGCMFPVDIDTAIEAQDGTILNYDKTLIYKNELSIIPELEKHIKDFLNRWDNVGYTLVDEYFHSAMLMVLFAGIPSKIINIRLDKMNTNEVHPFHMENFFNSHFKMWNNVKIFREETKFWLYKNLPYLIKNIGKQGTLDAIVNKVFDFNSIGIAGYDLLRPDPILDGDGTDINKPSSIDRAPALELTPMNDSYEVETNNEIKLDKILTDELNTIVSYIDRSLSDEYIKEEAKKTLDDINNNYLNIQPTKILDIKINRFFKNYGVDLFKVIFDYWAYLLDLDLVNFNKDYEDDNNNVNTKNGNRKIKPIVEFIDPNTSKAYNITPYQGFLFALKILLTITNEQDTRIIKYKYDIVLNPDKNNILQIFSKLYMDGNLNIFIKDLHKNYPNINSKIFNTDSFHTYLKNILNYYTYVWSLDANSESCITSAIIKQLFYYDRQVGKLRLSDSITGDTIDDLLTKEGLIYDIPDSYDLMLSLNSLVRTFTGYNIDEYYTKNEILENSKQFLGKLTAYTTQVLTTSDTTKSIFVYYNNINLFKTKNPIIGEIQADVCPYEHSFLKLRATGYNVIDNPVFIIENVDYKQSAFERLPHVEGIGKFTKTVDTPFDRNTPPKVTTEIKDSFVFDITKSGKIKDTITLDLEPTPPSIDEK